MRHLVLPLLTSAALLAGCGDTCDPNKDAPQCVGNVSRVCPEPGVDQIVPSRWRETTCETGTTCIATKLNGFCALQPEPSPVCNAESLQVCDGTTTEVRCIEGFQTSRSPCIECSRGDGGFACTGGLYKACSATQPCATGLTCSSNGLCIRPATDGG